MRHNVDGGSRISMETLMPIAVLIASCVLAACGQLMFRIGSNGARELTDFMNFTLLAGIAAYGVSTLLWIWSLSRTPLVFVYPFTMLTFALVYAGSIVFLKERFPWTGYIGLALIFGGLIFVVMSRYE